ncbi:MAG: tripartite tricarboxylate transporter TctB family protein [Actinomycetota bacterium]
MTNSDLAGVKTSARAEVIFVTGLIGCGVFLLSTTHTIQIPLSNSGIGPRFLPYVVGSMLIVLGVLLMIELHRGRLGKPEDGEDVDLRRPTDVRTLGLLVAVLSGHIAVVERVGWLIAGIFLFACSAIVLGARRPVPLIVISLALPSTAYLLFTRVLDVSLPSGPWG